MAFGAAFSCSTRPRAGPIFATAESTTPYACRCSRNHLQYVPHSPPFSRSMRQSHCASVYMLPYLYQSVRVLSQDANKRSRRDVYLYIMQLTLAVQD